jgi:hypothetical protein
MQCLCDSCNARKANLIDRNFYFAEARS